MKQLSFFLICFTVLNSSAQTIMRIHQDDGTVLQLPIAQIDSITYSAVGDPGQLPQVTTLPLGAFSATTATLGGEITPNGGTAITNRGVAWSLDPTPTTADSTTSDGSGTGIYESILTELTANTVYYCRAYATNGAGTSYGNEVVIIPTADFFLPADSVTDGDGNTYGTVLMGNGQQWMTENLRVCTYANGDSILNAISDSLWASTTSGAWAYYDNNELNVDQFGKLYNGWSVDDERNICPVNWHVPTDAEWTALTDYLGGLTASGAKLKSTGFSLWLDPNYGATNESGFTGFPGGFRNGSGVFGEKFGTGSWWASTGNSFALFQRTLFFTSSGTFRSTKGKAEGLSVRCVKE